ncbi:hypothetical protein HN385_03510 [archaeon]|jgi:hypothetical protein|nr:hypothetical protein [archaeon]MBT3450699.1 hypothetical protein [archaeon]MBT6869764.1 hypothetical protein [archaeon]MBT7192719.1 hypothetical protein [archaeon]MBT7380744.1 hypothetical protein [archaeon]
MKCKPCKYLLAGMIVLILLLVVIFVFFLPGEDNSNEDICKDITDTSQRSDCYNQLAKDTGNVKYCKEVSYYYEICINQADVNRESSKSEIENVCDKITDTSRRNSCYEYADQYY